MTQLLTIKELLLSAFEKTLVPDKDSIQKGTEELAVLRKNEGCCLALLEIADDVSIKADLRQAALAQLKIAVERRWSEESGWKNQTLVSETEKAQIRKYLFPAIIRCKQDTRFLKLYKAIVKKVIANDYDVWLPIDEIIAAMKADVANIVPALHFAQAIVSSFELQMDEVKSSMDQFIKRLFPALYQLIQTHNTPENIFLVTKILWKSFHMQLGPSAQIESIRWIPIILEILKSQNPDIAKRWKSASEIKNTPEFFYFHSKKWAARIIFRYVQRHANSVAFKENKQYEEVFFSKFGHAVMDVLLLCLTIPTIPKCLHFLLRSLNSLTESKPLAVDPYATDLLFNKLPPFLTLTPEDDLLARENPAEFLRCEFEHFNDFSQIKKPAAELWINLNKIDSKLEKADPTPGKYIFISMEWLKGKLEGSNLLEKEMAMYLVCRLWPIVMKIAAIKNAVPMLLRDYVLVEFNSNEMLVRARALDVFREYGSIDFPDSMVLQKAVEGIYKCLTNDPSSVVSVKAAAAFNTVLCHKEALKMVRPYLNDILSTYVKMLDTYDHEDVVKSLQGLVSHYSNSIAPFAAQLVQHLCAVFLKYCKIDMQKCQEQNYDGEVEFAASGCLNTISKIISSPIPAESLPAIEEFIIPVLSFCLTKDGNDHFLDSMDILGAYLYKTPVISPQMWFFYPIIIYYVIGINQDTSTLPVFNPNQQLIFDNLHAKRLQEVDLILAPLRVYIAKGHNLLMAGEKDFFGARLLALIFQLTDFVYQSEPDNEFEEIDQQRSVATALLTTLLEHVQSNTELMLLIWQVIKANLSQEDARKYLISINIQLLSVCIYKQPLLILQAINQSHATAKVFTQMMTIQGRFEHDFQKKRFLLGLSSILRNARAANINDLLPPLFRMISKQLGEIVLIRQEELKLDSDDDSQQNNTDDESSSQFNDEAFWDENHDAYYIDSLANIDEAVFFEQSLGGLRAQDPDKYLELVKALTAEEMKAVEQNVQQAKQIYVKLQEKKRLKQK